MYMNSHGKDTEAVTNTTGESPPQFAQPRDQARGRLWHDILNALPSSCLGVLTLQIDPKRSLLPILMLEAMMGACIILGFAYLLVGYRRKLLARASEDLTQIPTGQGEGRLLLAAEDQTESERLRAAAEASERRLRELVQSIDAIIWEAEAKTHQFTFVS